MIIDDRATHQSANGVGVRDRDGAERARRARLAAWLDPISASVLDRLWVQAGWHCLDVAGAAGSAAPLLAARARRAGRVVAGGPAAADPTGRGGYDLAHCRLVLGTTGDPAAAVRRVVATLGAGGWLVLVEPDFSTVAPADPSHAATASFAGIRGLHERLRAAGAADAFVGRRVPDLLASAGLGETGCEATVECVRGGSPVARAIAAALAALAGSPAAWPAEREALDQASAWLLDPRLLLTGPTIFAGWGRRPR
jgi:hypothetical protein